MAAPADLAKKELGVREPFAFDKYAGGRNEHWCAHFVSWLYVLAGQPLPGYKTPSKTPPRWNPIASVNTLYETLKSEGKIVNTYPRKNDLIFYYKNGKSSGPKGHVGIVTEVRDGKVISIEGNLSDQVKQVTHSLNAKNIAGYGRVYKEGVSPLAGLVVLLGSGYITWKVLED